MRTHNAFVIVIIIIIVIIVCIKWPRQFQASLCWWHINLTIFIWYIDFCFPYCWTRQPSNSRFVSKLIRSRPNDAHIDEGYKNEGPFLMKCICDNNVLIKQIKWEEKKKRRTTKTSSVLIIIGTRVHNVQPKIYSTKYINTFRHSFASSTMRTVCHEQTTIDILQWWHMFRWLFIRVLLFSIEIHPFVRWMDQKFFKRLKQTLTLKSTRQI